MEIKTSVVVGKNTSTLKKRSKFAKKKKRGKTRGGGATQVSSV